MDKRSRIPRSELQISHWPPLDDRVLDPEAQVIYRRRREAVKAYASGASVSEAVRAGVDRKSLMRLIARALRLHPDGRVWGWRALVPHARVKTFERQSPPKVLVHTKAGNAGAFAQLLTRFPELETALREELRQRRVTLAPGGEKGRLSGVKAAAERFRSACRKLGLTDRDYPLNQSDRAVRSLAHTLRGWLADDVHLARLAAGARIKPASALRRLPERAALRAFDTVEFDAHKMDLRLTVVDVDPAGGEQVWEIERVWLLAIIDVATRCILGWHLSLAQECDRSDVVQAIRRALTPQTPPEVTLPGLRLLPDGGFVSHSIEATRFACWRQIRLDNARANLATTSLDVLCDTLGCTADFGPAYQPDDRPFIERFFGTVTRTLSKRLPGALPGPHHTEAMLARLRKPGESLRLLVTVEELEELLSVAIWNYHGTPHAGLGGATPLQAMRRQVLGRRDPHDVPIVLRRLPELLQQHPALLNDPVPRQVHGNLARGERPYITFMHVRYTSEQLARRVALVGQTLRVHADPADLRTLTAVTSDGEVMEPLLASSIWRHVRHSLWLRREFFKAKREQTLSLDADDNPIDAFVRHRRASVRKKALKRSGKRAASDLARAQHDIQQGRSSSGAPAAPDTGAAKPSVLSQLATGPVKARKLHIEPGFTR